ncbi:uncharacterized protein AMSG_01038 [Thecamonas trahens ATCC 50062]|uniref:Uncharacterized protein n=1 Tax=Thecamonas trahens ATCC 50062 TaxID=461836 RepID=A0A0L0DJ36_THETB|nr:hypothetical protein AMSG_01038 [Thecamonas trahens ATCC 50062]KNC52210.1 hypothetical protein AMSG_01038 [Thecamonas trahens ATCC 50062]|eukprot:XP_013762213.1 hypothetical protein AMSG_01038 [Thecamonas trahens ATCC 50062]
MHAGESVAVAGPERLYMVSDLAASPPTLRTWASAVDGAVHNAVSHRMALRKGATLQVFDMEQRAKLASSNLPDVGASGIFARWLSPDVLGVVAAGTLLLWDVSQPGSEPVVETELDPLLGGSVQITALKASPDLEYICIGGLAVVDGHINGVAQFYTRSTRVSVPLQAHAFEFSTHPEAPDTPVLIVADRPQGQAAGSLSILPLPLGDSVALGASGKMFFFSESDNDFPVAVCASPARRIVYTVSKFGFIFINELASAATVYTNRISDSTIFVSGINLDGAFVGVNVAGQVLCVDLNFDALEQYVASVLNNPSLLSVFSPLVAAHRASLAADATDALTAEPAEPCDELETTAETTMATMLAAGLGLEPAANAQGMSVLESDTSAPAITSLDQFRSAVCAVVAGALDEPEAEWTAAIKVLATVGSSIAGAGAWVTAAGTVVDGSFCGCGGRGCGRRGGR